MNFEKIIKEVKSNSLKETKVIKTGNKKVVIKRTLALITLIFTTFSLYSCGQNVYNENNNDNLEYSISDLVIENTSDLYEKMRQSGITFSKDLTPYDYKKIEGLDENDLYSCYIRFGESESEKAVIALGYDGWDDFLKKNNFETMKSWVAYEQYKIISSTGKKR